MIKISVQKLYDYNLQEFRNYLTDNGWILLPTKGAYEVLRATRADRQHPLMLFQRDEVEAITFMSRDRDIVHDFFNQRFTNVSYKTTNGDKFRTMDNDKLSKRLAILYRDVLRTECTHPRKPGDICTRCILNYLNSEDKRVTKHE